MSLFRRLFGGGGSQKPAGPASDRVADALAALSAGKVPADDAPSDGPSAAPAGAPPAGSDPRPRRQHYWFAHRLLPQVVFHDPARFLAAIAGGHDVILHRLWEQAPADGPPIPPVGLGAAVVPVAGRRCAVVAFPPPAGTVEAYFAGVVEPAEAGTGPAGEWRYFVLEKSTPASRQAGAAVAAGGADAVLCEWLADGGRRNHGRHTAGRFVTPTAEAFVTLVGEELARETERVAAGATAVAAPSWNPVRGEKPDGLAFKRAGFRFQHCVFAFDAVPAAATKHLAALVSAVRDGRAAEAAAALWEQSGSLCRQYGQPGDLPADGLRLDEVDLPGGPRALLFTMPKALAPPECHFVAVPVPPGGGAVARPAGPVVTLEVATEDPDEPPILGQISESAHGIIGQGPPAGPAAFLSAVADVLAGRWSSPGPGPTLSQLLLYAKVGTLGRTKADTGGEKPTRVLPPDFGSVT